MADRYLRLKIRAIEYKGGKCSKCGYNKCYAALEFHHRDPKAKEYSWTQLRKFSWERVKTELDKCDLICSNCHKETHWDPDLLVAVLQRHEDRQPKPDQNCKECGVTFRGPTRQEFCGHKCAQKNKEKISWPQNLPELVVKSSKRAVAAQLGISDKAVAKRLRNHHVLQ